MSTQENKAIVRRWMEEAVNGRNLAVLDEIIAPNYVGHVPGLPEPLRGPAGEKQLDTMFHTAFPDGRITIEDLIAEGDLVVARLTYRATHRGPFQGIPATGKRITMSGMHLCRLAGGKVVESWPMPDLMGLMQQLGVIPAAQPPQPQPPTYEQPPHM